MRLTLRAGGVTLLDLAILEPEPPLIDVEDMCTHGSCFLSETADDVALDEVDDD